jgi:adenylate cyclase
MSRPIRMVPSGGRRSCFAKIVFSHGGTIDKFIGDGLMVFFGDPDDHPDHGHRCVRCAIDKQKAVRLLNARESGLGRDPIQIRIGINTGTVVVGNMGSARRLAYSAIGSAFNLA